MRRASGSAAGDEGDDDIGGVAVQVLAAAVIHGGGPGIGMSSRDLDLARGTPASSAAMMKPARSIWGCTGPSPARLPMDFTQRWAVRRSRRRPSWRNQDGTVPPLADGQIDRAGGAWHQRNERRLGAFAHDTEHPMSPLQAHILDVGVARLGDPQPVQAQQHRQGGVSVVEALAVSRNRASSPRSRPRRSEGWTVGRRTYWAGLEAMRPSMWAKR